MPRYKPVNRQQDVFVPICFEKQIIPGTFAYTLHHRFEHAVHLSAFDAHYDNDVLGAFISRPLEAIQSVSREVLRVCDAAGRIGREHFAIDGVKLSSNASKELSGRLDELQVKANKLDRAIERMLKAHDVEDANDAQGDLEAHAGRQIERLNRQSEKIEAFLKEAKPKRGPKGKERKSNVTDNDSAKMRTGKGTIQGYTAVAVTDDKHQVIVEAQAHGAPQGQELLGSVLSDLQESLQDLSDNILSEAKLTADSGFLSGDNLDWLDAQQCDV